MRRNMQGGVVEFRTRVRVVAALAGVAAMAMLAAPGLAWGKVSIGTSARSLEFGRTVTLSGKLTPVGAPAQIALERRAKPGVWKRIRTTTTAAGTGVWSITLQPGKRASYRARNVAGGDVSRVLEVWVRPRLTLRRIAPTPVPFGGARVELTVRPASYGGKVDVIVRGPAGAARKSKTMRKGRARMSVPTDGVGRFRLVATTRVTAGYGKSRPRKLNVKVKGRALTQGARGRDVAALMRQLDKLGFHTPGHGGRFTFQASEVALAFKKAYGLSRNYRWGSAEWKKITGLKRGPRPKATRGSKVHLEVDKRRQLLFVARGAKVLGILHVSTGRTGNTPVGKFKIYQRGGSYLYRFMAFHGNYGLHGYPTVPPYPASAGCVREPMWAATWVWNQTAYGTVVHVYQ